MKGGETDDNRGDTGGDIGGDTARLLAFSANIAAKFGEFLPCGNTGTRMAPAAFVTVFDGSDE